MDEPVTDVAFVSSKENCPKGYRLVENCPCGHEAQLWEKVLGGSSGERFLCFTKEEKDDMVIEDMYIPGRSAQYLYKGYKIVKETVEGDEPMYHKQLAVKKVPRTHASKVVADIIICRSRDNVSKMYKKLDKVNGLCICFRQVDIGGRNTPSPGPTRRTTTSSSPSPSPTPSRPQRGGSLKIEDVSRHLAGVSLSDQSSSSFRRGSAHGFPLRRSVSPLASHTQTSPSPSPQPPPSPPRGEATLLSSTPPLSSTDSADDDNVSAPPPALTYPSSNTSYYPPPPSNSQYPPQPYSPPHPPPTSANYPPPRGSHTPSLGNYPPPSGGGFQATASTYPPPPTAYGPPSGGLGFSGLAGGPSGGFPSYPPPPPGSYGGYGAIAGPSFAAVPTAPPTGHAPYNPYQPQQGHTPYPPPPTSGSQLPPVSSFPNYGFNI